MAGLKALSNFFSHPSWAGISGILAIVGIVVAILALRPSGDSSGDDQSAAIAAELEKIKGLTSKYPNAFNLMPEPKTIEESQKLVSETMTILARLKSHPLVGHELDLVKKAEAEHNMPIHVSKAIYEPVLQLAEAMDARMNQGAD